MPSLQTALPPELADNVIRLYRECLRRAKYIGSRQHNTELVVGMVREQFKKHMYETDPEKIQKLKDDAARGLINHILYESEKQHNTELVVGMVREQFKKHMYETDPEKIQKLKDDAARGLINHILYESEKMTGRKFSKSS